LPKENKHFAFLEGKRLKTIKIRGEYSQGLLMPFKCCDDKVKIEELKEGDDLTTILGVRKYVHPFELGVYGEGTDKIPFPSNVPPTNEINIQERTEVLEMLKGKRTIITRKEEGCSMTLYFKDGVFYICGRNWILLKGAGNEHYYGMVKKYDIEKKMRENKCNLAIQGEVIGPKINGNRMNVKENDFKVFNIYDIDAHGYCDHDEIKKITADLGLNMVPVLFDGILKDEDLTIKYFITMADSLDYMKGFPAEGVVVKTPDRGVSFKVKGPRFLAKYDA